MNAKTIVTALSVVVIAIGIILLIYQQKGSDKPAAKVETATTTPAAVVEIKVDLTTPQQKASYAIGFQMASNLKQQEPDFDANAIALAIRDVMTGEPRLSNDDMRDAMRQFQEGKMAQRQQQGSQNKAEGEKYLLENKSKPGVKVTNSGLQYIVEKEGDGKQPKDTDMVKVHYRGTLINGEEFDSSITRGEPASFALNRVIKGWTEGVQLMKVGAKYKFFVPSELAYGESGAGMRIPPNTMLIFDIELLDVQTEQAAQAHGQAAPQALKNTRAVTPAAKTETKPSEQKKN